MALTPLQKLGSGLLFVVSVIVALLVGFVAGQALQPPRVVEHKLARAEPPGIALCKEGEAAAHGVYELALAVLQQTAEAEAQGLSVLWLDLGATRFLSHGLYGRGDKAGTVACPPADLYARVAETLDANHSLLQGRYVKTEILLLSKLPKLGPYLAQRLGETAFSEAAQPDEAPGPLDDLRPLARSVLAGFGTDADPFSQQAFEDMSASDSLGTGAAQVAVATQHEGALEKAAKLMSDVLASIPRDKVIPWETKYHLYELAYAIRFGGADATRFTAPVHELMSRKVESFASYYGMLEREPRQMCRVLKDIEGEAALAAYPYCLDGGPPDA